MHTNKHSDKHKKREKTCINNRQSIIQPHTYKQQCRHTDKQPHTHAHTQTHNHIQICATNNSDIHAPTITNTHRITITRAHADKPPERQSANNHTHKKIN